MRSQACSSEGPRQNAILASLTGTESNRSAVGARVTLETGLQRQMDEVRSGGSYFSHNDFTLYFGVGMVSIVDRLEVRWPNGKVQEWKDLPVNQRFWIREGSPDVQKSPLPRADKSEQQRREGTK